MVTHHSPGALSSLPFLLSALPSPFPQVREAAVRSLVVLLGRLAFSRPYYLTIEELMMQLARDTSDAVFTLVNTQLLPALQVGGWLPSRRPH